MVQLVPYNNQWSLIVKQYKKASQLNVYSTFKLMPVIVKTNCDLR